MVRNPNQWSLKGKNARSSQLNTLFSVSVALQLARVSLWNPCTLGAVGEDWDIWWVVLGCAGLAWEKTACKPGGTWASQMPLLDFPSQNICPLKRLPEEQSCLKKQNNVWKWFCWFQEAEAAPAQLGAAHVSWEGSGQRFGSGLKCTSLSKWCRVEGKAMMEGKTHEICQTGGQTWYLVENNPFSGHFWRRDYQHGFVSIPFFQSVKLMLPALT